MAEANQKVVLLVEDDPNIQEVYSTVLKYGGYDVQSVITGEEALKAIEENKPRVVLLDLMIPGMPGIEVLKALRTNPKYQSLDPQPKIVVVTNVADPEMVKAAKQYNVDRYVIKAEISVNELPEILRSVSNGEVETKAE